MADIIKLLSDSVANQIAAGEVIQRPASVVKELVENAIDAGATEIKIAIIDAGRTLIQVSDNGKGMSPQDARTAFERHATSKISSADDLFAIRSMGFRGEALASIAAVASVELRTKTEGQDLGTCINISGSKVESQEVVNCPKGANFIVKNLFYNVPARRKFLKSDPVENRHITTEIHRIVLANPEIAFQFMLDNKIVLTLNPENHKQRIVNVFGKSINQHLVSLNTETSIVKISGFVAKPERTRKTTNEQFFFVNKRFMIHPYFRKAISIAYEKLIPEGEFPSFFVYLEIDPSTIDINIHPTKTEIKFEEEQSIFQILKASVKEALGKFNIVPGLDFEENITRDVHLTSNTSFKPPTININPDYNPFKSHTQHKGGQSNYVPRNWSSLYEQSQNKNREDFVLPQQENIEETQNLLSRDETQSTSFNKSLFFQLKNKYIITSVKSGMVVIDQKRAHERILYENFLKLLETRKGVSQRTLFPVIIEPSPTERAVILEIITDLNNIGFEIVLVGKEKFELRAVPGDLTDIDPKKLIDEIVYAIAELQGSAKVVLNEKIALALAKTSSIRVAKPLTELEMQEIFQKLMLCSDHNYTPERKKILEVIKIEEIEQKLN